jgi:hypothetical protein
VLLKESFQFVNRERWRQMPTLRAVAPKLA